MPHHFIAARHTGLQQFRAMFVKCSIQNRGGWQTQRIKQCQTTPRTYAVAVIAPGVIQHIGLRRHRANAGTQAFTERKMLQVKAKVHRKPCAIRPTIVRPLVYGAVVETAVAAHRGKRCGRLICVHR